MALPDLLVLAAIALDDEDTDVDELIDELIDRAGSLS
jgi:hypothetical protein